MNQIEDTQEEVHSEVAATEEHAAAAQEGAAEAKKPKKARKAKVVDESDAAASRKASDGGEYTPRRGRESAFVCRTLVSTVKADPETGEIKNPRKEGSFGHKSLQIIIDAGTAGIGYKEFIAAGGRLKDLVWDVNKNHVYAD